MTKSQLLISLKLISDHGQVNCRPNNRELADAGVLYRLIRACT